MGKPFVQSAHGLHLGITAEHATFEFEVLKPVALLCRFGQTQHGIGAHGYLVTQTAPIVGLLGFAGVRQIGSGAVTHKKQVTQHLHGVALLALAQQSANGQAHVLPLQIEQGRLHGGDGVDGGAQVKGLLSASAAVSVGKLHPHGVQDGLQLGHRLAFDQWSGVLQGLANFLAARHFSQAHVSGGVGDDDDVSGEKRRVGTGEVEQHAVSPGNRDDAHGGNGGGCGQAHGVWWFQ